MLLIFFLFTGKEPGNYWRTHAKDKWRMMKIYLMAVFYTHCLFVALSFFSIYVPLLRILVEHYQYALLEAGSIFSMLNPFLLRKILQKNASVETVPKQRYNSIPSSSSSSSLSSVSSQLSDDSPLSSFDSVSIQLSDDNVGISSSSSFDKFYVSIELSDEDDNVRPIKGLRKARSIAK